MIDVHLHAGSPGAWTPAEALALARAAGYRAVALLARCDAASLPVLLPPLARACRAAALYGEGEALAGVELVQVPPPLLEDAVGEARSLGAQLVAVHGEVPGGEVPPGSTLAAIRARADVVLHPGLIRDEEAALAAETGVALELSLCPRHAGYNGHVALVAGKAGACLVTGSNAGRREDLVPPGMRRALIRGAGLDQQAADRVDAGCLALMSRLVSGTRLSA